MRRPSGSKSLFLAILPGLFSACGNDSVAGKTTTTTNGGGGKLLAVGPDGNPLSNCVAYAARSWDPLLGQPGRVDTLRGDASGNIILGQDAYSFLEIHDSSRSMGAWIKRVSVHDGNRQIVALDTLRRIQGKWSDRSGIVAGRILLDSSLRSASLKNDGSFAFEKIPVGSYSLALDADSKPLRHMGSVRLESHDVRYTGSGNIIVAGDTTGSPLWIDDFESISYFPLLHRSTPSVSPWYVWASLSTMSLPVPGDTTSMLKAIGPDSVRSGRAFHSRFVAPEPYSWVAAGITGMEIDIGARSELCFGYRSDTLLKVQFQRDSVGTVRPTVSATLPSSMRWKDVCIATDGFVPNDDTPDSLKTWSAFGKRVLVIEFQTPSGGTFLDLDDIRLR
jgi:hypothetical protein